MAHNCWFVEFRSLQVSCLTYRWSAGHGERSRDRRRPRGGGNRGANRPTHHSHLWPCGTPGRDGAEAAAKAAASPGSNPPPRGSRGAGGGAVTGRRTHTIPARLPRPNNPHGTHYNLVNVRWGERGTTWLLVRPTGPPRSVQPRKGGIKTTTLRGMSYHASRSTTTRIFCRN